MNISKETKIIEVLKKYPASKALFKKYHMGCASCMGSVSESIKAGCLMHGVDSDAFLKELLKIASFK